MTQVSTTITIHAPPDAIWSVISDFGAAAEYLSGIVHCAVEGQGIGALRTLTSSDGSTIVERLDFLDDPVYQLSYLLLTRTPFRDSLTTVALRDLGKHQTELAWSATFEPDGLPESEAAEMMEGALAANCVALKQYMEANGE